MDMMDNMRYYNAGREVPDAAKKTIKGGKLSGFTDINPMWRIQKLTELFGVCGVGWYTEIKRIWAEEGKDGRVAAFCEIHLYVKVDGEWSRPIEGIGGSMLVNVFKGSPETSDECYKMAYTDAISVAAKAARSESVSSANLGAKLPRASRPAVCLTMVFLLLRCVSRMDAVPYAARNSQPMEPFLTMTIVLLELWFKSRFLLCLCKFALQKFYASLV